MRKAVGGAIALLVIFVLAVAAVPRLVDVAALSARLSAILEETTGRKVRFARPTLVLFPRVGIRVAELEISGGPSHPGERLLAAPEADFRMGIVALLQGRAEFSTIVLRRPAIALRKGRDGTTSLSDIAPRVAAGARKTTRTAAEAEIGQATVRPRAILIEEGRAAIRVEERAGGESRYDVGPFSLRLSGIGTGTVAFDAEAAVEGALRGSVRFHGSLAAEAGAGKEPASGKIAIEGEALDQPFRAEGTVSDPFGRAAADLTIAFPRIEMDDLPAVLAENRRLAEAGPEGFASLSVRATGEPDEFGFEAEADLTRAGWTIRPGLRKFIDAPFSIVLQGRRFSDRFIVSNAEFRFPPLLLIANGSGSVATGAREWSAASRIASLEEFARSRGALPGWSPSGMVTASGRGTRAAASGPEEWRVSIDLGDAGFAIPGRGVELRGLNGHVEAAPGSLSFLPLSGLVNGQGFSLRGSVALGAAAVGKLDLRMAYLDLDALLGPRQPEPGKQEAARGGGRAPEAAGTGRKLSARAQVEIQAGKAGGIEFRGLRCDAAYDNGTVRIDSARAEIYGGAATFSGRFDPFGASPAFRVRVAGKGLRSGELLAQKTSLGDLLSGEAEVSGEISGGMKSFDDFANTAAGSGSVRVTNGRIRGVDVLRSALLLSGLERGGAAAAPGGGVPGITEFREFSATFLLRGARVRTDDLRIASDRMRLSGRAAVGLDKTLEFMGTLVLPRGVRPPGIGAARYLADPSGGIAIPLVMSGALASPAVAVDQQALSRGGGGTAGKPPGE